MLVPHFEGPPSLINNVKEDREAPSVGLTSDEMLAVLAHELRSPLAVVRNALEASRRCDDDAVTRQRVLGLLERQTHQMVCLIDGLQDFTRICHGQAPLQQRSIDLAQMVHSVVETVRPHIDERGHVLEVALPSNPVILMADPTWIQQMLTNLLMNATKYTDLGGRIWLTGAVEGDDVVLRVRDSGIGIAAELLPRIFDFFWQATRPVDRREFGLGIGLALVHKIVEMHGGFVTAFSAGLDQGSEFVVVLPQFTSLKTHNNMPRAEKE